MGCLIIFLLVVPYVVVSTVTELTTGHKASAGAILAGYAVTALAIVGVGYLESIREAAAARRRQAWLAGLSPEERAKVEREDRQKVERLQREAEWQAQVKAAERARDDAEAENYRCSRCMMRIHRDASMCPYCHYEF